ncbi:synaptic vesicle glycoprotein 2B-like isoform X2 [Coccinella septempunctata]|uniref:synaptic vesicle glycoprotein 2B-like isoform X2 n=1 Tax=Coccinella septempunctata TaxID=41139 RepID=UPI001D098451|nr:synaptic vesicle glycoprotein 2B-like isoform X2 [Coccinella septempunctata]
MNDKDPQEQKPADFETAVSATSFGKFNWFLICVAIPVSWANLFETTTMSYVFPAAQCDLNLTLEDKGMLNAAVYCGTITSAFFWGFFFDTFGRRKLLMIGYFLDAALVTFSAFAPNKHFLMILKFFGGFIISGPYAAAPTYLSELHAAKYRSRMPLLLGVGMSLGSMFLPLLAAVILPLNFKFFLVSNMAFNSWGLYLLINAVPALLSAIIFVFLPESPKFLMSMGRNSEALDVFQMMYRINTGNPIEMYPVSVLQK